MFGFRENFILSQSEHNFCFHRKQIEMIDKRGFDLEIELVGKEESAEREANSPGRICVHLLR